MATPSAQKNRPGRGFVQAFGYYWRQTRRGVSMRLGPWKKIRIYMTVDGRYTLRVNGCAHSHGHGSREAAMRAGLKAARIPFQEAPQP